MERPAGFSASENRAMVGGSKNLKGIPLDWKFPPGPPLKRAVMV